MLDPQQVNDQVHRILARVWRARHFGINATSFTLLELGTVVDVLQDYLRLATAQQQSDNPELTEADAAWELVERGWTVGKAEDSVGNYYEAKHSDCASVIRKRTLVLILQKVRMHA